MIAIVPARGGSVRVPGKNLRPLGGRPLVAHTIEAARAATRIDRVIVSTDDESIARVAVGCGAEVPFLRPASLATSEASPVDVVLHVVTDLVAAGEAPPAAVVLLQPTSPLRLPGDIDAAVSRFERLGCARLASVTPVYASARWLCRVSSDGFLVPVAAPGEQAAGDETIHALNGAIYVAAIEALRRDRRFSGPETAAYVMPRWRSIDIDEEVDLVLAEAALAWRAAGGSRDGHFGE